MNIHPALLLPMLIPACGVGAYFYYTLLGGNLPSWLIPVVVVSLICLGVLFIIPRTGSRETPSPSKGRRVLKTTRGSAIKANEDVRDGHVDMVVTRDSDGDTLRVVGDPTEVFVKTLRGKTVARGSAREISEWLNDWEAM